MRDLLSRGLHTPRPLARGLNCASRQSGADRPHRREAERERETTPREGGKEGTLRAGGRRVPGRQRVAPPHLRAPHHPEHPDHHPSGRVEALLCAATRSTRQPGCADRDVAAVATWQHVRTDGVKCDTAAFEEESEREGGEGVPFSLYLRDAKYRRTVCIGESVFMAFFFFTVC